MKVKILGEFSYQSSPESDDMIEVNDNDLKELGKTKIFDVQNNCIKDYEIPADVVERMELEELRRKRVSLLEAFDKWEKAVLRGREQDSEIIMQWYRDLLDLKATAFVDYNVPDKIKYFL